jgi:hypothetical protein
VRSVAEEISGLGSFQKFGSNRIKKEFSQGLLVAKESIRPSKDSGNVS